MLANFKIVKNKMVPSPFIVGVSRSGTTLLRLMLDAHPELAIPPETHFIPPLLQLKGKDELLRQRFFESIINAHTWNDFHISNEEFKENLSNIKPFNITAGLRCFYKIYAGRYQKERWGDKTPIYNLWMSNIYKLLPEAHFIHLIRDGRDVALSLRKLWFGPGNDICSQAEDWVKRIQKAREQAKTCKYYLEVRYEDLIMDTESTLKKICSFIEISYNSRMEIYYETASSRLDEFQDHINPAGKFVTKEDLISIHQKTTQLPDQTSVYKWRNEMSQEEQEKFEKIAGDMLRNLGYETKS